MKQNIDEEYKKQTTPFQTKWEQAHCGLTNVSGVHSNFEMYTKT